MTLSKGLSSSCDDTTLGKHTWYCHKSLNNFIMKNMYQIQCNQTDLLLLDIYVHCSHFECVHGCQLLQSKIAATAQNCS